MCAILNFRTRQAIDSFDLNSAILKSVLNFSIFAFLQFMLWCVYSATDCAFVTRLHIFILLDSQFCASRHQVFEKRSVFSVFRDIL